MARRFTPTTVYEKDFVKGFDKLCYRHNPWTVWRDFVNMFACSIANAVSKGTKEWEAREQSYLNTLKPYSKEEISLFCEMAGCTAMALDDNPAQDFLGNLYMGLDFGSGWHGQFFTPWHVAEMMARMMIGEETYQLINEKGWVSVNDPACGAGCMLMAYAQACRVDPKIGNYQLSVLFVGQDLDKVVAQMCYIQLSLLGCAGYVIVGNTLTNPIYGNPLNPWANKECELWLTPMFFSERWTWRRIAAGSLELFV